MNNGYPSDLNDNEWELIEHFFERPDPRDYVVNVNNFFMQPWQICRKASAP